MWSVMGRSRVPSPAAKIMASMAGPFRTDGATPSRGPARRTRLGPTPPGQAGAVRHGHRGWGRMGTLLAARLQMEVSLAFHMVFAALGIGLPLLDGRGGGTGAPHGP